MRRRCAERADAEGASQSGWAGSGTGSSRTPPERTGISPVGSRCEQHPRGHKHLRRTPTPENTVVSRVYDSISQKEQPAVEQRLNALYIMLLINNEPSEAKQTQSCPHAHDKKKTFKTNEPLKWSDLQGRTRV